MPQHRFEGDECIIKTATYDELGWRKVRGRIVPFSKDIGIGQYFSNLIMSRIHKQKPCNCIFTGEPGISKSYDAIAFARFLQPSFGINQVAMTYAEFMQCMIKLPEGAIIVLDEPEYVAGHREWYRDQNRALVSTMRSGRFKVHPCFLPLINKSLLDKVIREHLLQYMVVLEDRGEGTVYQLSPSHFTDQTYTKFTCRIKFEMLDVNKCEKPWCFSCKSFKDESCQLLRAQYEHKRQDIQDKRYKEDLDKSQKEEGRKIPYEEWIKRVYDIYDKIWYETPSGKRKISSEKIQLLLGCSQTMAQRLRGTLKQMTREEVEELILKRFGLR